MVTYRKAEDAQAAIEALSNKRQLSPVRHCPPEAQPDANPHLLHLVPTATSRGRSSCPSAPARRPPLLRLRFPPCPPTHPTVLLAHPPRPPLRAPASPSVRPAAAALPQESKPIIVKLTEVIRPNERKLFISSIPREATEEDFAAVFRAHGEVVHISLHKYASGERAQYAFVWCARARKAASASRCHRETSRAQMRAVAAGREQGGGRPLCEPSLHARTNPGAPTRGYGETGAHYRREAVTPCTHALCAPYPQVRHT